jgi:CelD/BcsL family acetyltransferase involved in cellulose biosynthesis
VIGADRAVGMTSALGIDLAVETDMTALAPEWRRFERHAASTVFQAYDFLAAWRRKTHSGKAACPVIVTGRDRFGALLFIMPFRLYSHCGVKVLGWLAGEHCNYQTGLFDKQFLAQLNRVSIKVLWREITALLPNFDCLYLKNQPESLVGCDNPFAVLGRLHTADRYYAFALDRDYSALYKRKRSGQTRRAQRKRDARLDELGEVTFAQEYDGPVIADAIDTIFDGKNRQLELTGSHTRFEADIRTMFRDAVAITSDKNPGVKLLTLRLNGDMIAGAIIAVMDKAFCGLILYMPHGYLDTYSPGDRLLRHMIEWACHNGYEDFDLSLGHAGYKLAWADDERRLFETIQGLTPLGLIYAVLAEARCQLKCWVKASPRRTRFLLGLRALARRR